MTRLLMIDNYDSFTYNLVQYFGELGAQVEVFRNDEITIEGVAARKPERLVISPGPAPPPRPASRSRRSATSPASCRSWVFAWATRASVRPSAARSCARSS